MLSQLIFQITFRGIRDQLGQNVPDRVLFLENVVDGGQQYSGNGNDGFLASTTPFECKVTISDFRELLVADGTNSALNK